MAWALSSDGSSPEHCNPERCNPEHLVELVRSQDPSALDALTRCYGAKLLAAGRRHCRTEDEARDAVQDAWVVAATELAQFRGEGSLEGWLVRVVASACFRLGRGGKNDPFRHDTEVILDDPSPSPEARTAQRELGSRIESVLLDLAPVDRAILLLFELEGWTTAEIGARFALSEGAVRTRLSRLRTRVRSALNPR